MINEDLIYRHVEPTPKGDYVLEIKPHVWAGKGLLVSIQPGDVAMYSVFISDARDLIKSLTEWADDYDLIGSLVTCTSPYDSTRIEGVVSSIDRSDGTYIVNVSVRGAGIIEVDCNEFKVQVQ